MIDLRCRGKRLNGGEWVFGGYTKLNNERHFITDLNGVAYPVDPDTVGRYIGIKDINNCEVCEHDIVRIDPFLLRQFDINEPVGKVYYHKGIFFVGRKERLIDSVYALSDLNFILRGEVIGNIFDNPDLLEEAYYAGKHEAN